MRENLSLIKGHQLSDHGQFESQNKVTVLQLTFQNL